MKKQILLLLMVATVAFSGCKTNDDTEPENSVVGKWFVKKTVNLFYEGGTKTEEKIETDFGSRDFLELKADGTGILSDEGDTDILTYAVKENILSLTDEPGETANFTIKKLTSKEIELVFAEEFTEGNSGIVYKSVQELYLSK